MKRLLELAIVLIIPLALGVPGAMAAHYHGQGAPKPTISADSAIVGVYALGFVDTDGAKLFAIVVEYNVDMTDADVSLDKYEITDYGISTGNVPEIGSDPGVATDVYVCGANVKAKRKANWKAGVVKNYVIIKVNTNYQMLQAVDPYAWAMMAGVTQTGTITTRNNIITAGTEEVKNYEEEEVSEWNYTGIRNPAIDGTYKIYGIDEYQLFTKEAGTAFRAVDCWEESTGEYTTVDLPYALYVPKNYNPRKKYALVLHIHDAGFLGDDPMIALTSSQGPANYASNWARRIVKAQGRGPDGIIVLCPMINSDLRSMRDDGSTSAAVPATWQLMDYITSTYNIDMNRIYGEGQSMGGMQIGAMAAQRDNYFAATWANGAAWWSNFNLEDPTYNGTPYYQAPADGTIIWTTDAHGNPVDYRNWYYMVSDDNMLITDLVGGGRDFSAWTETKWIYYDLAGAQFPYTEFSPVDLSKDAQNAAMKELFGQAGDLNAYWVAFNSVSGGHMTTWIYSHGITAAYEWFLTQTRESEMARGKLDLNKPFEAADVQIDTADRYLAGGNALAVTGKSGAGTIGYNSCLIGGSPGAIRKPGWTPDEYAASIIIGSGRSAAFTYYETIQDAVDAVKDGEDDVTINVLRSDKDTGDIVVDGTGTGMITIQDVRLSESYFLDTYGSSTNRLYKTAFAFGFDIQRENVVLDGLE